MQLNDRVQFIEDMEDTDILLGTIERMSEGVIKVRWDNRTVGMFSPGLACHSLRVVTGDAAVKRHEFQEGPDYFWRCVVCGAEMNLDTRLLPCFKSEAA